MALDFEYDFDIKMPISVRIVDDNNEGKVVQTLELMLGSEVIGDDTLVLIHRDISEYIAVHVMRNR